MSRQFLQSTTKLEKRFTPLIIVIIRAYRRKFASDLKRYGKSQAISILNSTPISPRMALILKAIYKVAGLMGARLTSEEAESLRNQKAGGFGRNETWIRDVLAYLRFHLLRFVSNITETMREDILKMLEKAVDQGWGIDETVRNLLGSGLIEARARVIARTEIIRAANVGHSVSAASLPYEVTKKWSAARDERTRHAHRKVNGKTVDEYEVFKVPNYKGDKFLGTYSNMQYPGDATAPVGQVANCRCRAVYLPKRNSDGKLIMRNPNQARVVPISSVQRNDVAAQISATLKNNIHIGLDK